MAPTLELLEDLVPGAWEFEPHLFGGAAIDVFGQPLTDETFMACKRADAVLLGAVGGPKWENDDPSYPRPEQGLLDLRTVMKAFANLRPVKAETVLQEDSPLRPEVVRGTDLLIVRELTGGIYFGEKKRSADRASDLCEYTREEITRIARVAFREARVKVTSVDKANVLETSRLWRQVVSQVQAEEFPDVELEHMLVDNAAMQLNRSPRSFDVLLTENMFGDILSDQAASLIGSIGLLPSASLGEPGRPGIFEPIHGSAPDIAGQNIANPMGMFKSAAMMLENLGLNEEGGVMAKAVSHALQDGIRTADLGGDATTTDVTQAVQRHL